MKKKLNVLEILLCFLWMNISSADVNLRPSRTDLNLADHYTQIFKLGEQGYINIAIIKKAQKESRNFLHFEPFRPWLESLLKISDLKAEPLLALCHQLKKQKTPRGIERKVHRQSVHLCRQFALQNMANIIIKQKTISPEQIAFIESNLKTFILGRDKEAFRFFMEKVSAINEVQSMLSEKIKNWAIKTKKLIPSELIPYLIIDADLTEHIQESGFNPQDEERIYWLEMSRLIDSVYKSTEAKEPDSVLEIKVRELLNYKLLGLQFFTSELHWIRLNDLARSLWRAGKRKFSLMLLGEAASSPFSSVREEVLFTEIWMDLSQEKYEVVIEKAEKIKLVANISQYSDSRLKFWIAYAYQEKGNTKLAQYIYENIITRHPLNFYAILSYKKLRTFENNSPLKAFYQDAVVKKDAKLDFSKLPKEQIDSWIRLFCWGQLDFKSFIPAETKTSTITLIPNEGQTFATADLLKEQIVAELTTQTAIQLGQSTNYLESFKIIYQGMDEKKITLSRAVLETLYPRPYIETISKLVKDDIHDPMLILSLVRQESVFNPGARSLVGARGLMQLMPDTARRMKRFVREKSLNQPDINLELGVKYFKVLSKRFDNNFVYVLASYNAGENRVDRWKNVYFSTDSMVHNVEAIPFLETRNYVKLIYRNLFFYKSLFESEKFTDPVDLNQTYNVVWGFRR